MKTHRQRPEDWKAGTARPAQPEEVTAAVLASLAPTGEAHHYHRSIGGEFRRFGEESMTVREWFEVACPPKAGPSNMAKRRGQRNGYLLRRGPSWILRSWEDARDDQGNLVRQRRYQVIGPAVGTEALSRREAQRIAWEEVLFKVDARNTRPSSLMTVREFVKMKFEEHVAWKLKPAGRKHYEYLLGHILPVLGDRRLCGVTAEDVEAFIRHKHEKGYSGQTVRHFKKAISAVFRLAKKLRLYQEENPASGVTLPEVKAQRRPVLNWEEARSALARLPSPVREMATLGMTTSVGAAEMTGIRLKHANLTDRVICVDGEALAPCSIAVRENYYPRPVWQPEDGIAVPKPGDHARVGPDVERAGPALKEAGPRGSPLSDSEPHRNTCLRA